MGVNETCDNDVTVLECKHGMLTTLPTVCGVGMPNQKCVCVCGQGVHLYVCDWSAAGWNRKCHGPQYTRIVASYTKSVAEYKMVNNYKLTQWQGPCHTREPGN